MSLLEFGDFWPKYFEGDKPPFTRRVAKRLIGEGELPGRIIDERPYIDVEAFERGQLCQPSVDPDIADLV